MVKESEKNNNLLENVDNQPFDFPNLFLLIFSSHYGLFKQGQYNTK